MSCTHIWNQLSNQRSEDMNHSERGHALLSASGASRWLKCPPSAVASKEADDQRPTSVYAEEGTFAHELSELHFALKYQGMTKRTFNSRLKKMKENEFYNEELHDYVMQYVDYVEERINDAKARNGEEPMLYFEERVDFSRFVPDGFGTADVVIFNDGVLEVIDLKFGKGVPVSAENNPQLKLYAIGGLEALSFLEEIHSVVATIVQPRLNNISSHEYASTELLDWGERIKPIAEQAAKGEGEFNPGEEQCRFCGIKATCAARTEKMRGLTREMKEPYNISLEELSDLLYEVDEIAKWAKDVKDYAQEKAVAGATIEGWKLVEGRSLRKYTDEDAVAQILSDKYDTKKVYEKPKILSISKLEKAIGKKTVEEVIGAYIEKPQGKPTLVPESDKRQEMNSADSDFDEIKE